ncbi:MAG: class I SAM-dependent methyltransferase [Pyrinomonadaceae bacterium]
MLDPTKRFSNRAENYLKYRPRYPAAIIPLLESECGLTPETVVADVGSGTGFMTELFLKHGNRVFGIEPNAEMRSAGERLLAKYPNFSSLNTTAERTSLPDNSIDLVIAGQAFHWFDQRKAKLEFARILRPRGWLVLVWNGFRVESSPLVRGYHEVLLRHGTDYSEVSREIEACNIDGLFAPLASRRARFDFKQVFDFEGLKGRLLSASYTPQQTAPNFDQMIEELRAVFEANQRNGTVDFDYETVVYYGQFRKT